MSFEFDNFFITNDDPGVEEVITMRGVDGASYEVPIRVKRGLTLGDAAECRAKAVTTHFDAKGNQVVDGFDESTFTIEVLVRVIKSWPFTKHGQPVPVTREHLRQMLAVSTEGFQPLVERFAANKKEAQAPFESKSDEA